MNSCQDISETSSSHPTFLFPSLRRRQGTMTSGYGEAFPNSQDLLDDDYTPSRYSANPTESRRNPPSTLYAFPTYLSPSQNQGYHQDSQAHLCSPLPSQLPPTQPATSSTPRNVSRDVPTSRVSAGAVDAPRTARTTDTPSNNTPPLPASSRVTKKKAISHQPEEHKESIRKIQLPRETQG